MEWKSRLKLSPFSTFFRLQDADPEFAEFLVHFGGKPMRVGLQVGRLGHYVEARKQSQSFVENQIHDMAFAFRAGELQSQQGEPRLRGRDHLAAGIASLPNPGRASRNPPAMGETGTGHRVEWRSVVGPGRTRGNRRWPRRWEEASAGARHPGGGASGRSLPRARSPRWRWHSRESADPSRRFRCHGWRGSVCACPGSVRGRRLSSAGNEGRASVHGRSRA